MYNLLCKLRRPGILLLIAIFTISLKPSLFAQTGDSFNKDEYISITGKDGIVRYLERAADDDEDGIDNVLEVNGFTYSVIDGLQPWNGDPNVKHFITDPLSWSSDQDPYSDLTEASGVNMPPSVLAPENHPLVAARPKISIKMEDYDVIIVEEITNSEGGYADSSFTNEVTNENTVGGSVTVEASLNPFKLVGGSATAEYSHTWANTESSTSSWGSDWNNARTTKPDQAARLVLRIYMENTGSAAAGNVQPTFNLKLGDRSIRTVSLTEPDEYPLQLAPGDRFPKAPETLVIGDDEESYIYISLDELKAIQAGTPLSMVVIQVSGDVMRWNSSNQSWETYLEWASYENPIDEVTVSLLADLGNDETYRYQVYAGTEFWDPGFEMRDILSFIFEFDNRNDGLYIEDRKYPDKWYFSSPSEMLINEYNNNQPDDMLDLKMFKKTTLILFSPGPDPKPEINLATYTPDFDNIWVSARPNTFPIQTVTAVVQIDGEQQEVELTKDERGFYSRADGFEIKPQPGGIVRVENAAGEIAERRILTPAIYTSAADVKKYSFAQPVTDGEYFISLGGDPEKIASLYCLFYDPLSGNELAEPREYLTLSNGDSNSNFVELTSSGDFSRFYFDKIRINPATLAIDDDDNTFVNEVIIEQQCGECLYWLVPARYGISAAQYTIMEHDTILANINLSGTPFSVDTSTVSFNQDEGITSISDDFKIFDFFSSADYPSYGNYDFVYGWKGEALYLSFEAPQGVSDIGESDDLISAKKFSLKQNFPNPFNPVTTIRFTLPERSDVKLTIYNMLGQQVVELINTNNMTAGKNEAVWDGIDAAGQKVSSGIYIYHIQATSVSGDNFNMSRRMVLLK
jgi:hypothetical protein